jgi:hypothetical protein
MSHYSKYKNKNAVDFQRLVGVSYGTFGVILSKLMTAIEQYRSANPLSKRGRKGKLPIEDQLLLTLLYLRQYDTFITLGTQFGISESYAQKRYTFISSMLLKSLDLPEEHTLELAQIQVLAIDVTEQPIERPVKKQVQYYSGKKTTFHKSTNSFMLDNRTNQGCKM